MDISPLLTSLKISFCATILIFFLGIITAYKMYFYNGKLKIIFEGFINISLVLPPTVTGFILLVLLGKYGIIGSALYNYGITIIFTWQAGVIASFFVAFPLMYRSVIASFDLIEISLFESAKGMGASNFQILRYVALPLAIPGITSGIILAFLRTLGEFGATLMVAGNIPTKTQTISTSIYFYAMGGDIKVASFWVIFLIVISFLFLILVNLN